MKQRSRGFPARLLALTLVGVLLLAACGGSDDPTPTAEPESVAAVPETTSGGNSDTAAEQPASEAESDGAAPAIEGQPDAPAPVDSDFRSDPATLVAATGNPQLLEFFTFW